MQLKLCSIFYSELHNFSSYLSQVFSFSVFSLPLLCEYYKEWIYPYLIPTIYPLTSITLTISLYMVIALSIERFLSITNSNMRNMVRSITYLQSSNFDALLSFYGVFSSSPLNSMEYVLLKNFL